MTAADPLSDVELGRRHIAMAFASWDSLKIGQAVKEVAQARGVSSVAAEAGVTRQFIYRLGEEPNMRFRDLLSVLKVLGWEVGPDLGCSGAAARNIPLDSATQHDASQSRDEEVAARRPIWRLRDDAEAWDLVDRCLRSGDPAQALKSLQQVALAHGIPQVAKKAGLRKETLYRVFRDGNATMRVLLAILGALGMSLALGERLSRAEPARHLELVVSRARFHTKRLASRGDPPE
ncbi:helix-turn-helix domain-containing transcriptional regulator [Phenylobacterium sp.]|uniref:helix-turn-helix domain-containing transcriptional regulator n=1 Tax=Phenylobacterium sp. TaxID=1871053 RepID=UPI002FC78220